MITIKKTVGIVLAGGLSRRMEGPEKSLLDLGSRPLITRVVKRLNEQVADVVINANGEAERFAFLRKPIQADTVEGFAGPLAGVLAGMTWVSKNKPHATHIITAAADTPFFPQNYASKMLEKANKENAEIALAGSNNRHHPVFGLWPIKLHDDLQKFLVDEENRKVMLFVERYANCRVDFENNGYDPFFNVNTPEDLAEATKLLDK